MTDNEATLFSIFMCIILPSIIMLLAYIIPSYLRDKGVNNMQYDTENMTLDDILVLLDKGEILEYDYGVDYEE